MIIFTIPIIHMKSQSHRNILFIYFLLKCPIQKFLSFPWSPSPDFSLHGLLPPTPASFFLFNPYLIWDIKLKISLKHPFHKIMDVIQLLSLPYLTDLHKILESGGEKTT